MVSVYCGHIRKSVRLLPPFAFVCAIYVRTAVVWPSEMMEHKKPPAVLRSLLYSLVHNHRIPNKLWMEEPKNEKEKKTAADRYSSPPQNMLLSPECSRVEKFK